MGSLSAPYIFTEILNNILIYYIYREIRERKNIMEKLSKEEWKQLIAMIIFICIMIGIVYLLKYFKLL